MNAEQIAVEAGVMLRNLAVRLREGMDVEEVALRADGAADTLDKALASLQQ